MADAYRITSFSDKANDAVLDFKRLLESDFPQIAIDAFPKIAHASEYSKLLDDEIVDIVVVPFSVVPQLANSPL